MNIASISPSINELIEKIRNIVASENIPLMGFGPASAMANEPVGYRPEDLLPGAKGLLCFAIPVPRALYNMSTYTAEMICRAQNQNYRYLDMLSIRFANLLEENGQQAIPIFGCQPMGVNKKNGYVEGYLNKLRMGEATGIGVIGNNRLLINSRYGARLMLGGVITTANFPMISYPESKEPGCPPDCRICEDVCPVRAISIAKKRISIMRCLGYTARTPLMSKTKFLLLRAFKPEKAARLMSQTALDEHSLHICSKCVALCPYGDKETI
jgi:epoxyqueuosine reductase QueG